MLKLYKQITSVAVTLMLIALGSCTPEIDDVFEDSALSRLEAFSTECQQTLIESEFGWVVDYYPKSDKYGGYSFIMSFDSLGRVAMYPELGLKSEKGLDFHADTSSYRVHSGQSSVLSFDTYSVFHQLSDAEVLYIEDEDTFYFSFGTGYGGDFELSCKEIDSDKNYINFEGLKGNSKTTFTKLKSQEEKEAYLGIQESHHNTLVEQAESGFFLVYNNDSIEITYNNFHYFLGYENDEAGDYSASPLPFAITSDGIKLYEPITIAGDEIQDFVWNEVAERFESGNGAYFNPGGTIRGLFTDPSIARYYQINLETSSEKFLETITTLNGTMKGLVKSPEYFSGISAINFMMNGYPSAQAFYGGSHRIEVSTEYMVDTKKNMFIFGTTPTGVYTTKFNYAIDFSDGMGGVDGYEPFHNIVKAWFVTEFAENQEFNIELDITWSYGKPIKSYKISRKSDADYYIIFRPL